MASYYLARAGAWDWTAVPLQSDENPLLLMAFLTGFGLMALYGGWRQYHRRRLIEDTPTEKVRSIAAGRTELQGQALPREEPFSQPFTDGTAVIGFYRIEEYEPDDDNDGSDWETIESEQFTEPFFLEDDTGRVLVDPDDGADLEISGANTTKITVGKTEEEPEIVKEFLQNHSRVNVPDSGLSGVVFGEKRRYTQGVIPPGEEVYVFGGARPRADAHGSNAEQLVIGADETSKRFVVSDKDEDALASEFGRSALLVIAIGIGLLALAFYFFVTELGIAS